MSSKERLDVLLVKKGFLIQEKKPKEAYGRFGIRRWYKRR